MGYLFSSLGRVLDFKSRGPGSPLGVIFSSLSRYKHTQKIYGWIVSEYSRVWKETTDLFTENHKIYTHNFITIRSIIIALPNISLWFQQNWTRREKKERLLPSVSRDFGLTLMDLCPVDVNITYPMESIKDTNVWTVLWFSKLLFTFEKLDGTNAYWYQNTSSWKYVKWPRPISSSLTPAAHSSLVAEILMKVHLNIIHMHFCLQKAALDCRETLGWQFMVMLENSLWIWFGNFKEPFYMPRDYPFLSVVHSSSCSYPVGILYSSVLCVFTVFHIGCLFVMSIVNPAGILCLFVKRSFNVRFIRGVYVNVPIYGLNNVWPPYV